MKKIIWIN